MIPSTVDAGPPGAGRIWRLRKNLSDVIEDQFPAFDSLRIPPDDQIPVFIERPSQHDGGANVVYLDGHAEFLSYPGEWPMTEESIGVLLELDGLGESPVSRPEQRSGTSG